MADGKELEQMKQKYASVLKTIEQQQIRLSHVHMQENASTSLWWTRKSMAFSTAGTPTAL